MNGGSAFSLITFRREISYVNTQGIYVSVNRAYTEIFGLPREEVAGKPVEEIFGSDNYKLIAPQIRIALNGKIFRFGMPLKLADGGKFHP